MKASTHIGFVCQAGRLEAQCCLLAASIRYRLGNEARMTATVAGTDGKELAPRTVRFLEGCGTELISIENPISPDYPIGNKLSCLRAIEDTAPVTLFMDSDMIVLANFLKVFDTPFEFMAKPADAPTADLDNDAWKDIFARHGVEFPQSRYMTTLTEDLGLPYFNAGFIALSGQHKIAECWIKHARKLSHDRKCHDYHLDQISLTLAVFDQHLTVRPVSDHINFPAHLKSLREGDKAKVVHYHHTETVGGNSRFRSELAKLIREQDALRPILASDKEWHWAKDLGRPKKLFGVARRSRARVDPDFVVTGIPRSGTSLFSSCLENLGEIIVINEPAEIFAALARPGGHGLASYYDALRKAVLTGQTVPNKVDSSERLVEDTLISDVRQDVRYVRERDDFPLGTKNTLAYLNRIEQIAQCMPTSRIFCCIRNPVSTIASWTRSFEHLRSATTGNARIGTSGDPYMSELEKRQLRQVEAESDTDVRRALWWNFLANRILKNIDRIELIRYEDFAKDPLPLILESGAALGLSKRTVKRHGGRLRPINVHDRHHEVSAFQLESIRGICASTAARFGYEI